MKIILAILALTFSVGVFANQQERDAAEIIKLNKQVKRLSKRNLSCLRDEDCLVLAVGNRACGGPSSYAITSKFNRKLGKLEHLIETTTEKEEAYNINYHVISTCIERVPPTPNCKRTYCR